MQDRKFRSALWTSCVNSADRNFSFRCPWSLPLPSWEQKFCSLENKFCSLHNKFCHTMSVWSLTLQNRICSLRGRNRTYRHCILLVAAQTLTFFFWGLCRRQNVFTTCPLWCSDRMSSVKDLQGGGGHEHCIHCVAAHTGTLVGLCRGPPSSPKWRQFAAILARWQNWKEKEKMSHEKKKEKNVTWGQCVALLARWQNSSSDKPKQKQQRKERGENVTSLCEAPN